MPDDDDLFGELLGLGRPSSYVDKPKRATNYAFGGCPKCTADKVGLVVQGGHLAWRDHYVSTWGGNARQCTAGGQHLCDLPARDVHLLTGLTTPTCICTF